MRGGLSTIDRDYGIFNKIHHDIGTHVVHHLFPQMPHYHLEEATEVGAENYLVMKETNLDLQGEPSRNSSRHAVLGAGCMGAKAGSLCMVKQVRKSSGLYLRYRVSLSAIDQDSQGRG